MTWQLTKYFVIAILQGVPLRVEIGPKDMASNQFVLVRRDNFEKSTHSLESGVSVIQEQIDLMHDRMFTKWVSYIFE